MTGILSMAKNRALKMAVSAIILIFSFGYSIAHADSVYSGCDVPMTSRGEDNGPFSYCANASGLSGSLNFYGADFYVYGLNAFGGTVPDTVYFVLTKDYLPVASKAVAGSSIHLGYNQLFLDTPYAMPSDSSSHIWGVRIQVGPTYSEDSVVGTHILGSHDNALTYQQYATWFFGPYVPTDTTTRIVDFTPEDATTTTNPVHFSMHAYINPEDIGTWVGIKLTLHNIDQNVLLLGAFSPSDIYLVNGFNATTSGDYYFATTTYIGEGNYKLVATMEKSYLGGWIVNPFSPTTQELHHQFIVGHATLIGNLTQNGQSEMDAFFASSTATTTAALAGNCNPIGGAFDVRLCGAFLFIPDPAYLATTTKSLKDGVLSRVPWGYLTRTYNIFTEAATSSLPTFTVHLRLGAGDGGGLATTSLAFDPNDMINGAGAILESTRDPIYGKNIRDIFEPLAQLLIGIAVLLTIINNLTGMWNHIPHGGGGEGSANNVNPEKLREWYWKKAHPES